MFIVICDVRSRTGDINPAINVIDPSRASALVFASQLKIDGGDFNRSLPGAAKSSLRNSRGRTIKPTELGENPRPLRVDQCISIGLCGYCCVSRSFCIFLCGIHGLFQNGVLRLDLRDAVLGSLCRSPGFPSLPSHG
jgi:hypothetical protein